MNHCAWCSPSDEGTDGICDQCMRAVFNIDPATIRAEIAAEAVLLDESQGCESE